MASLAKAFTGTPHLIAALAPQAAAHVRRIKDIITGGLPYRLNTLATDLLTTRGYTFKPDHLLRDVPHAGSLTLKLITSKLVEKIFGDGPIPTICKKTTENGRYEVLGARRYTLADVTRFGSVREAYVEPEGELPNAVYLEDMIMYLDRGQIINFLDANPQVHHLVASAVIAPETLYEGRSINPCLYTCTYTDDGVLHAPDGVMADAYLQPLAAREWLRPNRLEGSGKYCSQVIFSNFDHHVVLISRGEYVLPARVSYDHPRTALAPRVVSPTSTLSDRILPLDLMEPLYEYSCRANVTDQDISGKATQLGGRGKYPMHTIELVKATVMHIRPPRHGRRDYSGALLQTVLGVITFGLYSHFCVRVSNWLKVMSVKQAFREYHPLDDVAAGTHQVTRRGEGLYATRVTDDHVFRPNHGDTRSVAYRRWLFLTLVFLVPKVLLGHIIRHALDLNCPWIISRLWVWTRLDPITSSLAVIGTLVLTRYRVIDPMNHVRHWKTAWMEFARIPTIDYDYRPVARIAFGLTNDARIPARTFAFTYVTACTLLPGLFSISGNQSLLVDVSFGWRTLLSVLVHIAWILELLVRMRSAPEGYVELEDNVEQDDPEELLAREDQVEEPAAVAPRISRPPTPVPAPPVAAPIAAAQLPRIGTPQGEFLDYDEIEEEGAQLNADPEDAISLLSSVATDRVLLPPDAVQAVQDRIMERITEWRRANADAPEEDLMRRFGEVREGTEREGRYQQKRADMFNQEYPNHPALGVVTLQPGNPELPAEDPATMCVFDTLAEALGNTASHWYGLLRNTREPITMRNSAPNLKHLGRVARALHVRFTDQNGRVYGFEGANVGVNIVDGHMTLMRPDAAPPADVFVGALAERRAAVVQQRVYSTHIPQPEFWAYLSWPTDLPGRNQVHLREQGPWFLAPPNYVVENQPHQRPRTFHCRQQAQVVWQEYTPVAAAARGYCKDKVASQRRLPDDAYSLTDADVSIRSVDEVAPVQMCVLHGTPGSGKSRRMVEDFLAHADEGDSTIAVPNQTSRTDMREKCAAVRHDQDGHVYKEFERCVVQLTGCRLYVDEGGKLEPGQLDAMLMMNPQITHVMVTMDTCQAGMGQTVTHSSNMDIVRYTDSLRDYGLGCNSKVWRCAPRVCMLLGLEGREEDEIAEGDNECRVRRVDAFPPRLPYIAVSPRYTSMIIANGAFAMSAEDSQGLQFDGDYGVYVDSVMCSLDDQSIYQIFTRGRGNVFYLAQKKLPMPRSNILRCLLKETYFDHMPEPIYGEPDPLEYLHAFRRQHVGSTADAVHRMMALRLPQAALDESNLFGLYNGVYLGDNKYDVGRQHGHMSHIFTPDWVEEVAKPETSLRSQIEFVRDDPIHRLVPDYGAKEDREAYVPGIGFTDQITDHSDHSAGPIRHRGNDNATRLLTKEARFTYSSLDRNRDQFTRAEAQGRFLFESFLSATGLERKPLDRQLLESCHEEAYGGWSKNKTAAQVLYNFRKCDPDVGNTAPRVNIKTQIVRKLEKRGSVAKPGQTISAYCIRHTLREAPYALYTEKVCCGAIPENFYLHNRKSPAELRSWADTHWSDVLSTESDYTRWDTGCDAVFLWFDILLMDHIGIPADFVVEYMVRKLGTEAFGKVLGIMQLSGDRWTWILNTLRNIALSNARFMIPIGTPQMFSGDDMALNCKPPSNPEFFEFTWKHGIKKVVTSTPSFCGHQWGRDGFGVSAESVHYKICVARASTGTQLDVYRGYADLLQGVIISESNEELVGSSVQMLREVGITLHA